VRKEILNRRETNEEINRAVSLMDKYQLPYSIDYILGLPTQTENELLEATRFFLGRKSCVRISPFFMAYLPKLKIIEHGLKENQITKEDVKNLEDGQHQHYVSTGSIFHKERLRILMTYRIIFRMIPLFPKWISRCFLKKRYRRILEHLPGKKWILLIIDLIHVLIYRDLDIRTYIKTYLWWIWSRLRRNSPSCFWREK
jgi:radical SAM superfamily enzyme YgiQ (UPF0313 family)